MYKIQCGVRSRHEIISPNPIMANGRYVCCVVWHYLARYQQLGWVRRQWCSNERRRQRFILSAQHEKNMVVFISISEDAGLLASCGRKVRRTRLYTIQPHRITALPYTLYNDRENIYFFHHIVWLVGFVMSLLCCKYVRTYLFIYSRFNGVSTRIKFQNNSFIATRWVLTRND